MAGFYEWLVRFGSLGQFSRFYEGVADAIEADPGALVLDVGCGPATLTPYLLPKVGADGSVLGMDIADEMIARARSVASNHGWGNVRFERVDARAFSPPAKAGIVVFCLSLTTLPAPVLCLSRALSWLKPGGQLVILDSFLEPDRRLAGLAIRMKSPLVGADPLGVSLATVTSSLDSARVQHFHGGIYTLVSGRKPSTQPSA